MPAAMEMTDITLANALRMSILVSLDPAHLAALLAVVDSRCWLEAHTNQDRSSGCQGFERPLHWGLSRPVNGKSVSARSMHSAGTDVALTYRCILDDQARFTSSKKLEPWVRLTPSRNKSTENDALGKITKSGDINLCRAL